MIGKPRQFWQLLCVNIMIDGLNYQYLQSINMIIMVNVVVQVGTSKDDHLGLHLHTSCY